MGRGERLIKLGDSSYSPKCLSGQPRDYSSREVERLVGCEGFAAYQVQPNSECARVFPGSEGAGAKVRVRERNNSDHRLRSPSKR